MTRVNRETIKDREKARKEKHFSSDLFVVNIQNQQNGTSHQFVDFSQTLPITPSNRLNPEDITEKK
jgi:hypothetical protein